MAPPHCRDPWKISVKGAVAWAENGPTHPCQLLTRSQQRQPKLSVDSMATPLPCHQPPHCPGPRGPEDGTEHLFHGCCHLTVLLEETHQCGTCGEQVHPLAHSVSSACDAAQPGCGCALKAPVKRIHQPAGLLPSPRPGHQHRTPSLVSLQGACSKTVEKTFQLKTCQ